MKRSLPLACILHIALAAMLPVSAAQAGDIRLLTGDAWKRLVASREGKPFVVAMWSVTCSHCPKELRTLGELRQRYPDFDVVLVATDTPADAPEARRLADGYGLGDTEQWIFADEVPERLRMAIDRRWHGELPRTYFFAGDKAPLAVSGIVPPARLEAWARGQER